MLELCLHTHVVPLCILCRPSPAPNQIDDEVCTRLQRRCNWWLRFALTIITIPWRITCYALYITRQLFNSWADIFIKLSSCAGTILLAVCTQLKKESLQLLWALTPYPCKAVYIWLWSGIRPHSSSPQVSAALGQPAAALTDLISLFAWPSISLQHEAFLCQDTS